MLIGDCDVNEFRKYYKELMKISEEISLQDLFRAFEGCKYLKTFYEKYVVDKKEFEIRKLCDTIFITNKIGEYFIDNKNYIIWFVRDKECLDQLEYIMDKYDKKQIEGCIKEKFTYTKDEINGIRNRFFKNFFEYPIEKIEPKVKTTLDKHEDSKFSKVLDDFEKEINSRDEFVSDHVRGKEIPNICCIERYGLKILFQNKIITENHLDLVRFYKLLRMLFKKIRGGKDKMIELNKVVLKYYCGERLPDCYLENSATDLENWMNNPRYRKTKMIKVLNEICSEDCQEVPSKRKFKSVGDINNFVFKREPSGICVDDNEIKEIFIRYYVW